MREICKSGSMRGMWKRNYGRALQAPPNERGGNSYARPNSTAPHPDSTKTGIRNKLARIGRVATCQALAAPIRKAGF
jgi:hypothetical protein